MASRAGTGIRINIEKVPRREDKMTPYEVMLSESQERMLIVVQKGKEKIAEDIFKKWGLDISSIGEVIDGKLLKVTENGKPVVEVPIRLITKDAPLYKRPIKKPEHLSEARKLNPNEIPIPKHLDKILLALLSSPNISSKRWIYEQYDYMVRTNTIVTPGSDSALIRIKGTKKALALTTNCNSRYCFLDPYKGAVIAVAESARNIACSGAIPLAITDCLNFGNPEKPEVMWQFKESIRGLSDSARLLNTPVVSGNVSFYNDTNGNSIYPTPTVAMVGLLDDAKKKTTQWFKKEGDVIVLLGNTLEELGGTEYLKIIHGMVCGNPPEINLETESSLIKSLIEAIDLELLNSAHDISEGGIACALAESCFTPLGLIGAKIDNLIKDGMRHDALLFSESQSRALVSLDRENIGKLEEITSKFDVPMQIIGETCGDRFVVGDLINIPIEKAYNHWANSFEDTLKRYA